MHIPQPERKLVGNFTIRPECSLSYLLSGAATTLYILTPALCINILFVRRAQSIYYLWGRLTPYDLNLDSL
jgi:hypothetical protein